MKCPHNVVLIMNIVLKLLVIVSNRNNNNPYVFIRIPIQAMIAVRASMLRKLTDAMKFKKIIKSLI